MPTSESVGIALPQREDSGVGAIGIGTTFALRDKSNNLPPSINMERDISLQCKGQRKWKT